MQSISWISQQSRLEADDSPRWGRAKILVIRDTQQPLSSLIQALKKQGYNVCSVMQGTNFRATVEAFKPDLVLLNMNAPQLNDFDQPDCLNATADDQESPTCCVSSIKIAGYETLGLSISNAKHLSIPRGVQSIINTVEQVIGQLVGSKRSVPLMALM